MRRIVLRLLVGLAVVLNLGALVAFGAWLSKTDFIYGHYEGPPERVIVALILSVLGVLATIAWSAAQILSPRPPPRPRVGVRRVLGSLAVLAITAPALIIITVGVGELDEARAKMRRTAAARTPTDDAVGVERLLRALNDEDYGVRHRAAYSLTTAPVVPTSAIPVLTEVAARREELTSFYAVQTLARLGPDAGGAIPVLIDLLDAGELLGPAAGEALGKIGVSALPGLLTASHSSDAQVRESTAQAFGVFNPPTEETISRLVALLGDSNARVRTVAAGSLGGLGAPAQFALPELDKVLLDPDPEVRAAAERAVMMIAEASSDFLRKCTLLLQHPGKNSRALGALGLEDKGALARPALPALHEAMNDPEPELRLAVAKAVWAISDDADQVIPTLVELLEHESTRIFTLRFVYEMGPPASGTLPALEVLAADADPGTRLSAAAAIRSITSPPE